MVREWFVKKATKTIETAVVEPAKKAIRTSTETGSDWLAKLLRLGIVGFLTLLAFREEPRVAHQERLPENTHVVINNYIYDGRNKRNDTEPDSH